MFSILTDSLQKYGLSLSTFEKYELKTLYLDSVPSYLLFYLAWLRMREVPLERHETDQLFESGVLGTLGYRILDLHFDERGVTDQEAIMGMALIQQHEQKLLEVFGFDRLNFELIRESKQDYFVIEVREKAMRGKRSPYSFEKPIECAYKAAPIFPAFALVLARLGHVPLIPTYKRIFYSIAATVQILDDLTDLKDDLACRQFTLPTSGLEECLGQMSPADGAETIYGDTARRAQLHRICCDLLHDASELADSVDDSLIELVAEYKLLRVHQAFLGKEAMG